MCYEDGLFRQPAAGMPSISQGTPCDLNSHVAPDFFPQPYCPYVEANEEDLGPERQRSLFFRPLGLRSGRERMRDVVKSLLWRMNEDMDRDPF